MHVIGYRPKGFSWTGEESILGAKCLADANGGLYIAAETREELIEALETLGVLVLGYQCDEFPSFYRRSSGIRLGHRVDSVSELAVTLRAHWEQLAGQGVLIANPIPQAAELAASEIEPVIARALARAEEAHVTGKALTPFLLSEIAVASGGRAVAANRALAIHNATLGAALAAELTA